MTPAEIAALDGAAEVLRERGDDTGAARLFYAATRWDVVEMLQEETKRRGSEPRLRAAHKAVHREALR